jgi:hypothetical protein
MCSGSVKRRTKGFFSLVLFQSLSQKPLFVKFVHKVLLITNINIKYKKYKKLLLAVDFMCVDHTLIDHTHEYLISNKNYIIISYQK